MVLVGPVVLHNFTHNIGTLSPHAMVREFVLQQNGFGAYSSLILFHYVKTFIFRYSVSLSVVAFLETPPVPRQTLAVKDFYQYYD